jgi:hypothetical protein
MPTTWNIPGGPSIEYTEIFSGWRMAYGKGQPTATKVFHMDGADAYDFCKYAIGFPRVVEPNGSGEDDVHYLERTTPLTFGQFKRHDTQRTYLYCTDYLIEALSPLEFDADISEGLLDRAKVTLTFEPLGHGVKHDDDMPKRGGGPDESTLKRYVSFNYSPSAQFLTLPRGCYKWVPESSSEGDPVRVDQSSGRIQVYCQIVYTWHDVPVIPDAIYTALGTVNDDEFDEVKAGTLFVTGATVKPKRGGGGQRLYDVGWLIKFFEPETDKTHNHFLRYNPGVNIDAPPVYRLMTHDGTSTGERVFKSSDFRKMFIPFGRTQLF